MSEQSERVLAWREKKRQEGYQPLTIWLKADIKHRMEDLAFQRRQDLAEMLTDAFLAWHPAAAVRPQARPDTRQLQAWIREEVAAQLGPNPTSLLPGAISLAEMLLRPF
jgi:hypothetical protein